MAELIRVVNSNFTFLSSYAKPWKRLNIKHFRNERAVAKLPIKKQRSSVYMWHVDQQYNHRVIQSSPIQYNECLIVPNSKQK